MASSRGSATPAARKWEAELSASYGREELVYSGGALDLSLSLPNMDGDGNKDLRNGAMRFPPKSRIDLPGEISEPFFARASLGEAKRIGTDLLENIDFLEARMLDLVTLVSENRKSCRAHGKYLYSLPFPPPDAEDVVRVRRLLAHDLQALRDDAVSLVNDIDAIRSHNIDAVLPAEISSAHPTLSKVRQSILKRCEALRTEVSTTEIVLHNLLDLSDDLLSVHHGPSCKLDGVEPDWGHLGISKDAVQTSNKAVCYVAWMEARSLPICDAVFEFLQSPTQNDHILAIVGYDFAPRELCELLEYVTSNGGRTPLILPLPPDGDRAGRNHRRVDDDDDDDDVLGSGAEKLYAAIHSPLPLYLSNVVHQLILDECQLSDYDVNTLATHLPALTALHTLCLRGNNITSLGATSLSTALWDRASELQVLRLDRNSVGAEGALSLSKAIPRCRYLQALSMSFNPIGDVGLFYILRAIMNPIRKARNGLPRPFQLSKKDGDYDFDDDIESGYSDDEDEMQRLLRRRRELAGEDEGDDEQGQEERKGGDESQTAATMSLYDSDIDSYEYVDNDDDAFGSIDSRGSSRGRARGRGGRRRRQNRGSVYGSDGCARDGDDDDGTDVYTMPNDEETVYSVALSRRSSVQLNPSAASLSLSRMSSKFDASALARMPLFLRKFRLVRFKIVAVAAFLRVKSRGHALFSLSVAGCSLTGFSLELISYALADNQHLGVLDLSHNPIGAGAAMRGQGEISQEQHDAAHVVGVAQIQLGMSRQQLRDAISLSHHNLSGKYETLVYDLSVASGIHPERLETTIFPAICQRDAKEIYTQLLCDSGLQTLSMQSCGLVDDAVQQLVQILNKGVAVCDQREAAESGALALLRNPDCVRDPQLGVILREHGINLSVQDELHHHKLLLALDKTDLDQIAATLKTAFQKPFLQSLQRSCFLSSLDLSDNHLGPTAANWVGASTGFMFLDNFQIGVAVGTTSSTSSSSLPRKTPADQMHAGHSRRSILRFADGSDYDDDGDEDLVSAVSNDDLGGEAGNTSPSFASAIMKQVSQSRGWLRNTNR